MRRETLIAAARRVREDLEGSGMAQMMMDSLEAQRNVKEEDAGWISIQTITKYAILTSTYSEAERAICSILNLSELSDSQYWQMLLRKMQRSSILEMRYQVRFAMDHLPKIVDLFKRDIVDDVVPTGTELSGRFKGYSLLSVILPEDDEKYSTVTRLIYILKSINDMYAVFLRIENIDDEELLVISLDSGSDKSIDFVGIARAIQMVKELVLSVYDRRVFHKEMKTSQAISLINESLPVLKKIEELRVENILSPEDAELLKRKMVSSVANFLESGAITRELDRNTTINARQLMRPEQKLLNAPNEQHPHLDSHPVAENIVKSSDVLSGLSESDLKAIQALLNKRSVAGDGATMPPRARKPRAKKAV